MKNTWYNLSASAETLELYIHDEIGYWGVSAKQFITDVNAYLNDANFTGVEVHINSYGGEVFDGLAIYHYLKGLDTPVTIYVDGIAASIASIIAMSADTLIIPANAYLMIHNPWCGAVGDSDTLEKQVELLKKLENSLANIYAERSGIDQDEIKTMMTNETWLDGTEAVELKFADLTTDKIDMVASINVERLKDYTNEKIINKYKELSEMKELQELQAKYDELQAENEDLKAKMVDEVSAEGEAVAEWKVQIEAKTAELEALKADHESVLAEKDVELNNLKAENEELLLAKDNDIADLNAKLAEYERAVDFIPADDFKDMSSSEKLAERLRNNIKKLKKQD